MQKLTQSNQRPNVRAKNIKLLEKNIRRKFHDIGFRNDFLDITSKAQTSKDKSLSWTCQNLKL